MRLAALAPTLSGRAHERARLLEVVQAGLDGSPRAVLVHGEAGIGKTVLVRSVLDELRAEGVQVLWGQGLRFGAVEAMYHPLVLALEGWLSEGDEARRAALVEAVPSAALILPSLGAPPVEGRSGLMTVVNALLSRVIAGGPTVVVVDDVHWADEATRDALSYLVAGFNRQSLALVTTHRDDSAGSDEFQRWLANLRRLPGTQEQVLARLDLSGTADQIAQLLGSTPSPALVEQVHDRTRGNPYFSELLVLRGGPVSTELPDDLPDELSQALLNAWRVMSPSGRELTRVLAVGGRPTEPAVLASVGAGLGVSDSRALREAIDAGVVVVARVGVWFRHALLADVLVDSFMPVEAAPVHAAWAGHLEAQSTSGIDQLRRLGDMATHHEQAGAAPAAFAALLRGADIAAELGAHRESADLLARAADLWDAGAPDGGDDVARLELLERAGRACWVVDRVQDAVRLLERARGLVDPATEPLLASRLDLLLRDLAWTTGEFDDFAAGDVEALVELSRVDPDSREHADALAAYAESLMWRRRETEAGRVAEDALAASRRSGSAAALAGAYGARSALVLERDLDQARLDAAASWENAIASGEPSAIYSSFISRIWAAGATGGPVGSDPTTLEMYQWSQPFGAAALMPTSFLAGERLHQGSLEEAHEILCGGLAIAGNPNAEAMIRLNAAVLAMRRGAHDAAHDHLARAREIMPSLEDRPLMVAGPKLAELGLAWGDPGAALALVERILPLSAVDSRDVDELLLWGVRAIGDLVERARDERHEDALRPHLARLTRLLSARAELPGEPFRPSGDSDSVQRARGALFAAELARAEGAPALVERWREAAAACAAAGMEWEGKLSSWRLAAALIATGESGVEVGDLLRSVHRFAVEQGAAPLAGEVEGLAALARISLAEPRTPASSAPPTAFASLTPRETEVLGHLVANRTYAEIAAALFISEKTVSVHVSNVLRKTGTGSRREVAALARRVGWSTGG